MWSGFSFLSSIFIHIVCLYLLCCIIITVMFRRGVIMAILIIELNIKGRLSNHQRLSICACMADNNNLRALFPVVWRSSSSTTPLLTLYLAAPLCWARHCTVLSHSCHPHHPSLPTITQYFASSLPI